MRKQKVGQFFYVVNASYYRRNDELQPLLLKIKKVIKRKGKFYYEFMKYEGYRTHLRLNLSYLRNFNPPNINSKEDYFYVVNTKLSAYLSNGSLERINEADAAKMLLLGTDETYNSPSYNRLMRDTS